MFTQNLFFLSDDLCPRVRSGQYRSKLNLVKHFHKMTELCSVFLRGKESFDLALEGLNAMRGTEGQNFRYRFACKNTGNKEYDYEREKERERDICSEY